MEKVSKTTLRKDEHLYICLNEKVESSVSAGFEKLRIVHHALPELDVSQICTKRAFFGKTLSAPLLISSMTGGSEKSTYYNEVFARAAEKYRIAMGVGSQRAAIEDPNVRRSFQIRKHAPSAFIFANLGAVQLNYGYGLNEAQIAIDMVEADALYLHLNPLQEALQPEGNYHFTGLLRKIEKLCAKLDVPVFVKEVGCGIGADLAQSLLNVGVIGIDVAGLGGTSWALVESYRASDEAKKKMAQSFANWGLPTVDCLLDYRAKGISAPIISSGGLRSGIDVYKSLALGASLGGFALPMIKAAAKGEEQLNIFIEQLITQLKIAMFCAGAQKLDDININSIKIED